MSDHPQTAIVEQKTQREPVRGQPEKAGAGGSGDRLRAKARGLGFEEQEKTFAPPAGDDGDRGEAKTTVSHELGKTDDGKAHGWVKAAREVAVGGARRVVHGSAKRDATGAVTAELGREVEGEHSKRSLKASVARDAKGAVSGELARSAVLEQGDLKLAEKQSLGYAKGVVVGAAERESRHRDVESGELIRQKRGGTLAVGEKGVKGVTAAVESERELDGDKRTTRLEGGWSAEEGARAKGSRERVVEVDGVTRKTQAAFEVARGKREGRVGSQAAWADADGTHHKTDRALGLSHDDKKGLAVDARAARERETTFEGQKVKTADNAAFVYGEAGARAEGQTTRTISDEADKTQSTRSAGGHLRVGRDGVVGAGGKLTREDGDEVGKRSTTAELDVDSNGKLDGKLSRETELAAVEGHSMKRKTTLAVNNDRVAVGREATDTFEREAADGSGAEKVRDEKRGGVGYGKEGLEVDLGRKQVVEGANGSHARDVEVGYGKDGFKAAAGDERVIKDEAGTTKTTRRVGVGKDGVTANVGRERVIGDAKGDHITTRTGVGFEKGNLNLVRAESAQHVDGDGATVKSSSENKVAIGKDGVVLGRQGGSSVKDAEGNVRETSHGVSANLATGEVAAQAGFAKKDAEGNERARVSGSGTVKIGPNGQLEKVSAEGSAKVGKVTIGAGAAIGWTFGEPRKVVGPDGQEEWIVEVTRNASIGGSGGGDFEKAQLQDKDAWEGAKEGGRSASVSVGGKAAHGLTRAIRVKSKAELDALLEKGPTAAQMRSVDSAEGARAMAVGESSKSSNELGANVAGSANIGMIKVGATFSAGSSRSMEVKKVTADVVRVIVKETSHDTKGVSGGTSAGSIGASRTSADRKSFELEFDVSKPEGRKAFDEFQKTGVVPKAGCRLVQESRGKTTTTTATAELLGASFADSSTVDTSVTKDEEGNKLEEATGTSAQGISVPLLGSHKRSVALETAEVNDQSRSWRTRVNVDSTNATDAAGALSDLTGTHTARDVSGKASGAWTVTSSFTDGQIKRLIGKIRAGQFNYAELFRKRDQGEKLVREVRAAGEDMDRIREALATYISETGADGMRTIRGAIDATPSYEVELQGDRYLTGAKVRRDIENQTRDFKQRAGRGAAGRGALLAEIDSAIKYHRDRLEYVQSNANYPELPRQIRAAEVERSRRAVAAFEEIRKGIVEAAKQEPVRRAARPADAFVQPPGAGEGMTRQAGAPGSAFFAPAIVPQALVPSGPEQMTRVETAEEKKQREAWSRATEHREHLDSKAIASTEKSFAEARRRHWIHDGAYAMKAPKKELGYSNLFGSGDHADDYKAAEGYLAFGKLKLQSAASQKSTLLAEYARLERDQLSGVKVSLQSINGWLQTCQALMKLYGDARSYFERATGVYRAIERANPTFRKWEIPEQMPDGYMR